MKDYSNKKSTVFSFALWIILATGALIVGYAYPELPKFEKQVNILTLLGILFCIVAAKNLLILMTQVWFAKKGKPVSESLMVGRLYGLFAGLFLALTLVWWFGKLETMGGFFAMFGGMLLGWSLQAPVSGFAAWGLVSLKRPFRPGDRVQFPNLNLVGDVKDIGFMYTVLDQVGGSIGSEEAVGRYILVPNAMLFSQVVINYTVKQDTAFMLDEVVIRITYDSNWDNAEKVLIDAATSVTGDIIEASGVKPYVRSDWWDYGVLMRLRYQTRVQKRVDISYQIQKKIFEGMQSSTDVDMAIPFIYSYRAGVDRRDENAAAKGKNSQYKIHEVPIANIVSSDFQANETDVKELMTRISELGLLQPIVVLRKPDSNQYEIMAGQMRFEACRRLGWKTIPAVVKGGN